MNGTLARLPGMMRLHARSTATITLGAILVLPPDAEADEYTTVVTASRSEEGELESPSDIDVVDRDDLESSDARTMPEAIESLPGVYVQKTSPSGGSPILHGLLGYHTLLLVDGVRINNSTWRSGPIQYMNLVDPWGIERIEVLKGPGSVLHGSDAMGGVIQVLTPSPALGSAPYLDPLLGARYSQAMHGLSLHASLDGGAGPLAMRVETSGKWFGPVQGGGGEVQPYTGYDEQDGAVKLAFSPAAGHVVTLSWQHVNVVDAGRADQLEAKDRLQWYDNLHELVYLKHWYETENAAWETILSWQRGHELVRDLRLDPGWVSWHRETLQRTDVQTLGASSAGHILLLDSHLVLSFGAQYYADLVDSSGRERTSETGPYSAVTPPLPPGSWYSGLGGFLMFHYYQVGPGLSGFHAYAGARLAWFSSHAPERAELERVDFNLVSPVGCAGLQFLIAEHLSTSLQYLQGFRAPGLSQSAFSGITGVQYEVPNPDLAPERAQTFEYNIKAEAAPVSVRASAFYSLITGFIVREATGGTEAGLPVYRNVNSGKAHVWGLDASLRLDIVAGLYARGSIAYAWGASVTDGLREPVSRIPPFNGAGAIGWEHPEGWFFAEIVARGASKQDRLAERDHDDPRIPEGGTPSWFTMDLRAGWRFHDRLEVGFLLENLLDERYRIHGSGFDEPGFSASLWMIVAPWR
jgi:outer membrane receptor protein involved in Fe transport